MSIYNSHRRFMKSVVAATLLTGVYVCFRLVTSPFLDVEPKKYHSSPGSSAAIANSEVESDAAHWFPNHSWVENAREQYFDAGRFLYCNESELINQGQSITLQPVAIRWKDEDADEDEVPVTLIADSAQLDLGSPISENATQIGRISGGLIAGRVQINGPRGLKIIGYTFYLSEDSMRLWSSDPVKFAWEGHRGTASSGVEILLQGDKESGGLTKVTEIKRMQLLGRVNCYVNMPATHKGEDDLKVLISAARGFTYDVRSKTGMFSGRVQSATQGNRQQRAKDQVWVRQLAPDDSVMHELVCPELVATFREKISDETGKPVAGKIEAESIRAWGQRVQFYAQEHDLHVEGNDFQYSFDQRRVDIRNTSDGSSNGLKFVKIRRGESVLTVPHVRILHAAEGGGVRRVECNGRGSITGKAEKATDSEPESELAEPPPSFAASWLESLVLQISADEKQQVVTMQGSASVSQVERGLKLSGQKIQMKLSGDSAPVAASPADAKVSGASSASEIDFGALQPEVLIASEAVTLDSAQGSGRLREKLTVRFEQDNSGPFRTISSSDAQNSPNDDQAAAMADAEGEVSFVADTLEATIKIRQQEDDRSVKFQDLWLKGDVEVIRQSDKPGNSFTATGNQLYAANGLKNNRQIQLFGDPAKVNSDTRKLEGVRIDLTELDGKAEVVGSGRIRFVTDKGFDGQPLPKPTPLDIYWSDRMEFHKRSADFVGNIRVVMSDGVTQDLQLLCSGMTVYFSKDVALGKSDDDGVFEAIASKDEDDRGPIERIKCHNRVTVNVEQFSAGVINARHNAVFVDLDINLLTGDFNAIGPGSLESVSPDRNGELQGSAPATARANASAQTTDTAFVHVKASFIGDFKGNQTRKEANLSQNVLVLVTPTRRVDEKINLQQIPRDELPERAGILRAEMLTISAVESPAESKAPQMFSIVARTNARLESRSLAASADVIQYDHSKEQFIIRADGGGDVTVHHRSGPNGRFNRFSGNRFEYYRRTNRLSANEINGLNLNE